MQRVILFLLMVYKRAISPWLPPACRFEPSCSIYAMEAVQRHGAGRGSLLALWRLLRCNPLFKGGYDPVPPKIAPRSGFTARAGGPPYDTHG